MTRRIEAGSLGQGLVRLCPVDLISLTPNQGTITGGTLVTVAGAGFRDPALSIQIGGVTCAVTLLSADLVQFTTPDMSSGGARTVVGAGGAGPSAQALPFTRIGVYSPSPINQNGGATYSAPGDGNWYTPTTPQLLSWSLSLNGDVSRTTVFQASIPYNNYNAGNNSTVSFQLRLDGAVIAGPTSINPPSGETQDTVTLTSGSTAVSVGTHTVDIQVQIPNSPRYSYQINNMSVTMT